MGNTKTHSLILYNDDFHDYLYVIASLIRFCKHTPTQAEQCAVITHNVGKCSIKLGKYDELLDLKFDLESLDLVADVEVYENHIY
jgi:ATP-dependent Clp protease adaptor protein ClpS